MFKQHTVSVFFAMKIACFRMLIHCQVDICEINYFLCHSAQVESICSLYYWYTPMAPDTRWLPFIITSYISYYDPAKRRGHIRDCLCYFFILFFSLFFFSDFR